MAVNEGRSTAMATAALLLLAVSTVVDAQTKYTATLSPPPYKPKYEGDNSPPPPTSPGRGNAEFSIGNGVGTYSLTLTNVPDFYQATINLLPASNETKGPVMYILPAGNATAGPKTYKGSLTMSDFVGPLQFKDFTGMTQVFDSGLAYVNIRTNSFPVSAIQGRIQSGSGSGSGSASTRPPSRRLQQV